MPHDAKTLGAYFTPEAVSAALVGWAVRSPDDLPPWAAGGGPTEVVLPGKTRQNQALLPGFCGSRRHNFCSVDLDGSPRRLRQAKICGLRVSFARGCASCASRIPNSLAESRIEATLRGA